MLLTFQCSGDEPREALDELGWPNAKGQDLSDLCFGGMSRCQLPKKFFVPHRPFRNEETGRRLVYAFDRSIKLCSAILEETFLGCTADAVENLPPRHRVALVLVSLLVCLKASIIAIECSTRIPALVNTVPAV